MDIKDEILRDAIDSYIEAEERLIRFKWLSLWLGIACIVLAILLILK